MKIERTLTLRDLVLMNLVAIIGLRWIATAAAAGPSSIALWLLAMAFFFIPQGLAVAELSSRFPEQGGVYVWTKRAFGDFHGFVCGWCYWVNNLFYFPSLLIFVSANAAFLYRYFDPSVQLDENKTFVTTLTLTILWGVAGLNIIGLKVGKWLQNAGGMATWIPALVLIAAGAVAWWRLGSVAEFSVATVTPDLGNPSKLSFFSEICFAFAGFELAAVLGGEIKNPRRTLPQSIVISGLAIAGIYLVGTLAVLVALPQAEITTVNGILLPIQKISGMLGVPVVTAVCAGLIAIGGCGGVMAWFAGCSRMPYLVGVDRYLPAALGKMHPRFATPHVAILVQAGVATLFTLIATAGSGTRVDTAYNILVDMTVILYFIPFLYLFAALAKLRGTGSQPADLDQASAEAPRAGEPRAIRVPGGKWGLWTAVLAGTTATSLAIFMTVFPPDAESVPSYLAKSLGGSAVMIGVGLLFYWRGKRRTA